MKVDLKALVKELEKPDGADQYRARVRLRNETARVGGKGQEAERTELAAALAKVVVETQPKERRRIYDRPFANTPMRCELLRNLCEIAGQSEVAVLMRAIDDLEIRDAIRRVVECVPGDEATDALGVIAAKEEGTEFRIGAINALGARKTAKSMEALTACAADPDPRIRLAAAQALACCGDPSSTAVVAQSFDPNRGWAPHANMNRTLLRLASNLAKSGNKPAADMVFRNVGGGRPEPYQLRAVQLGVQPQGR